jgi:hypothetical protein
MTDQCQPLEDLEARVSRGDRAAEGELRRQLEPWIALMVRRAMRLPEAGSPLQGLVQAEMDRLPVYLANYRAAEHPRLVQQIVQRIYLTMIHRLRSDPGGWRDRRDTANAWRTIHGRF